MLSKKITTFIVVLVVAAVCFGVSSCQKPPVPVANTIDPVPVQVVPSETLQDAPEPILLPAGVFTREVVEPEVLPPAPALEQTPVEQDYVFTPVPGVEYKPIWFKVPQQDLKYIR